MNACNCCGALVDEDTFDATDGYCEECDGDRPTADGAA